MEEQVKTIKIKQSEALMVTAIMTHLRQIHSTVLYEDNGILRFKRPAEMDDGMLLQSAASLRILLFDKSPILIDFIKRHQIDVTVEAIESDINLLLMAMQEYDAMHITDFFAAAVCDEKLKSQIPLDEVQQSVYLDADKKVDTRFFENRDKWLPTLDVQDSIGSNVSISQNAKPCQFLNYTRRETPIVDWGNMRIGYLKNKPMTRKDIVIYAANWLGGVHYNSLRKSDSDEFRLLASAMDWEDQSYMHSALVIVGLATIELVKSPEIKKLYQSLVAFYVKRKERLSRGELVTV